MRTLPLFQLMRPLKRTLMLAMVMLIVTACAANSPAPASDLVNPEVSQPTAASADWRTTPVRDVRTGETFTFADFAGRTVFVHPMATWCINCRLSQRNLRENVIPTLAAQGQAENVVFVSFTVETALDDETLRVYTDEQGFDWRFFVASPELMSALVAQFGVTIGVPPSQPHFIIRPDGTTTALLLGNPPPEQTVTEILSAMQT